MTNVMKAALMVILTAGAVAVAGAGMATAQEARIITTMGTGTVEAPPDMATIRLGVTNQASEASAAMAATSEAASAVLDRLEAAGVAPRDVQTDQLSVQPLWSDYSAETRRITGFVASNVLTVRVRDLDQLGTLLDLVMQDGANTFNGLSFGLQEHKPAQDAARAAAVRDALDRAAQLADAAGVTLGPVQTISEQAGVARPMMMEMAAARSADVPVAPGELTVTAQVSVVFAIAD